MLLSTTSPLGASMPIHTKLPDAHAGSLPRAKYIWILNYSSDGVPSVSLEVCELTTQMSPTVLTVLPSQMTNFLLLHHPC